MHQTERTDGARFQSQGLSKAFRYDEMVSVEGLEGGLGRTISRDVNLRLVCAIDVMKPMVPEALSGVLRCQKTSAVWPEGRLSMDGPPRSLDAVSMRTHT